MIPRFFYMLRKPHTDERADVPTGAPPFSADMPATMEDAMSFLKTARACTTPAQYDKFKYLMLLITRYAQSVSRSRGAS